MKIEIELNELESLRSENRNLETDVKELTKKLETLDVNAFIERSNKLAETIFRDVMKKVFTELGFEESPYMHEDDVCFMDLEYKLGKEWWKSEKLVVQLAASISTHFSYGYLILGINREKWMKEQEEISRLNI